jgi:putative aldouronate transport system permease protein
MFKDKSISSRGLDIVIHLLLLTVFVVSLYPILHLMALSFSSREALAQNNITIYPIDFSLKAYDKVFTAGTIPKSFVNSVVYTAVGTVINMFFTITMGYALSKKRLPLRSFFMKLVLVTMYFGGGLIPSFLLVKSLGMYNTIWALTVPGAISTYNLIVMHSFFRSLPDELEESAFLDGANDITILIRIVLPVSKAGIAVIALFYMVGNWNSFMPALIYLKTSSKYPLQLILREIVIRGQMAAELASQGAAALAEEQSRNSVTVDGLKYATLFISIVPMIIVYPFIQKYFTKGVMIGSLKG